MSALPESVSEASANPSLLSEISRLSSIIGHDIVDVAGFLDDVDREMNTQVTGVQSIKSRSEHLGGLNDEMGVAIDQVSRSNIEALEAVDHSVEALNASTRSTRSVAGWVQKVEGELRGVGESLKDVMKSNAEISRISKQVNMLAVNAKIEAVRAGEFGRGFSVVAEAINELSRQTATAATGITDAIDALNARVGLLRDEADGIGKDAGHVLEGAESTDARLSSMREQITVAKSASDRISENARSVSDSIAAMEQDIGKLAGKLQSSASHIHQARQQVNGMVDFSEEMIQSVFSLGGQTADSAYIELAQDTALRIGDIWERGIAASEISEQQLFSRDYRPIAGSNPQQFLADFSTFADRTVQSILDEPMARMDRLVGSGVQNTDGYMPTMTSNISKPQGPDPEWNTANCRNRRKWPDRVGQKSGRNTRPFLLQTYRRDMGCGIFVMMNDASAPIVVRGRHWGGVRILFKPAIDRG